MNKNIDSLTIEVINSEEALMTIEDDWNHLISESIDPSFYSTFYFVQIAWKHFNNKADRLFILLVKRDGEIVGIAPFRISIEKMSIISIRVIRFIAEWGEGDRPKIVTTENEALIWNKIYHFFNNEFKQWDGINLAEQSVGTPILSQGFFHNKRYYSRFVPDTVSFYISIIGTWQEYLDNHKPKSRTKNWERNRKKLYNLTERVSVQSVEDSETMPDALERFIYMEQSGWKKNYTFSVGGTERQKKFYKDLITELAHKKMVSIYLLKLGIQDIGGWIMYKCKDIAYAAHTAYLPSYSKYSPGIFLLSELLRNQFGTHYKEVDLLGMQIKEGGQQYKKEWGTETRKTIGIKIYKISYRLFLYSAGNRLKKMLKKVMPFSKKRPLSIFYC